MTFAFIFAGWVFSLCLHEFAHAAVAYAGGDHTVKEKGYLSLNPLKFADPFLSIILPLIILFIGGLGLPGGAVYIEHRLIRSRAWDCMVSLAGPAANLVLALLLAIPFQLGLIDPDSTNPALEAYAFLAILQITALLFNLIPIPPLDGFQAIACWFGYEFRLRAMRHAGTGFFLLIFLFWMVPGVSYGFWTLIFTIGEFLGIPAPMAIAGLNSMRML
jgi:Zn-dependent protease